MALIPGLFKGLAIKAAQSCARCSPSGDRQGRSRTGAVQTVRPRCSTRTRRKIASCPRTRRDRLARGELHRLHACARESAPTGASTSRVTRSSPRPAGPAASLARSTPSTGSTSTTRCACTAASALRCARSRRCSGARSTSTPSREIADLLHDKTRSAEWMETVPDFEATSPAPKPRSCRRCRLREHRALAGRPARGSRSQRRCRTPNVVVRHHRRDDGGVGSFASSPPRMWSTPRCGS